MKKILNWQDKKVVNIFDEVNLWAAPFGRMLLENLPMTKGIKIVDVGFGTGFPLIELSQRFGHDSKIYGIDIWKEGIERTKEKIKILEIENIELHEESASKINIKDNEIDLITSNLGVNNFEEKEMVYMELYRILKTGGRLCITTNPIGTFEELFNKFEEVFREMRLKEEITKLTHYINHRNTVDQIVEEFREKKFKLKKKKSDCTNIRFTNSMSLLNHSLIRAGFREGWDNLIRKEKRVDFYNNLIIKLEEIIEKEGEFKMTIPMLYLEFEK